MRKSVTKILAEHRDFMKQLCDSGESFGMDDVSYNDCREIAKLARGDAKTAAFYGSEVGFMYGMWYAQKLQNRPNRLKDLRRGRRFEPIASSCGISVSALKRYEAGETPRDEVKVRLANYYGQPVSSIWK